MQGANELELIRKNGTKDVSRFRDIKIADSGVVRVTLSGDRFGGN